MLLSLFAFAVSANAAPLPQLQDIRSDSGELSATLRIATHRIETEAVAFDAKLMNGQFPAPTLRVRANETMQVLIVNELSGANEDFGMNLFRQPLTFSYHTHGLHVSPEGISDNIYLEVKPGAQQQHSIWIPEHHAPGLHWYHAHHHGSSMLHMLNGLTGAIIIEDDESVPMWLQQMPELVILMNHLDLGKLADLHAEIQDPLPLNIDLRMSGDSWWMLNGAHMPTIQVVAQEWLRLRLVCGTHGTGLKMQIRGSGTCEMWLLANDGVSIERPRRVLHVAFTAGSRRDIALRCDTPGSYEVFGAEGNTQAGYKSGNWFVGVIASIDVSSVGVLNVLLPEIGAMDLWASPRPNYLSDLRGAEPDDTFDVRFGRPSPVNNPALVVLAIALVLVLFASCALMGCCCYRKRRPEAKSRLCLADVADRRRYAIYGLCALLLVALAVPAVLLFLAESNMYAVNGVPYGDNVMVQMKVNQTHEWTLAGSNHPFHMHTNHFQLIEHHEPDLWALGDWFDVVPADGKIRFVTDRFTGKLVLHCHRFSHEDRGMMAKIEIVP